MNYHKHLSIETDIIQNIYANPYYWNNPDYFIRLRYIVKTYKTHYAIILEHSAKDILAWISEMLPILSDSTYKTSTKVFWILSGMASFKKCKSKNCHSDIGINKNVNITRGYCDFCSLKCSQPDPSTRLKVKTSIEKRVEADHDFFKKAESKKRETKISHEKPPTWNNRDKAANTCISIYGVKYPMQNKTVLEKTADTKEDIYGDRHYTNRKLFTQTMMEKHRVEWPMQDMEMVMRGIQSKLKKYGTTTPTRKYEFDNESFDSKPELAFYVWLKDRRIEFKYHPHITIEFLYKGVSHIYLPDFEIDGKYVEIKGDQFFKSDGTMYCPYRHKNWSDEQYADICGLYEAKHKCMISNNVKIIRSKDYIKYLEYVKKQYGLDFFQKHKRTVK